MAETHELRLKINAAAARAGAREFVSAIRAIQAAVETLDSRSATAFTNINTRAKAAAGSLKQLTAEYNAARAASDRLVQSIQRANAALQRQNSLSGQRRSISPARTAAPSAATTGADQQIALQNRIQRAVDDARLSVERLTTSLMRVGGFRSINEISNAFNRFKREVQDGTISAQQLDTAKTKLNSTLKAAQTSLVTLTAKAREQARAEKEAAAAASKSASEAKKNADAANKAASAKKSAADAQDRLTRIQLSAAQAMRQSSLEAERLKARLSAVGDNRGIVNVDRALARLRATLSGTVGSTTQVRQAMAAFAESTNAAKISLVRAETAKRAAAKSARELAIAEREAAKEARRIQAEMRSIAGAANATRKAVRDATGSMRGLENAFSATFQIGSLFRTMLGAITFGTFTREVFAAGAALQQFRVTMEVATGSAKGAAEQMAFIDNMARTLGTNLRTTRDDFAKFAVASSLAGVNAAQARDIFEAVSQAMAVMGRGAEDQRLAFLALEQMMSKGTISSEELRRQLGERLPGAVALMAKAVGVSTGELQKLLKEGKLASAEVLPKFAQEVRKAFGPGLDKALQRAPAALGRLRNEFEFFLSAVADAGFMDALAKGFNNLTRAMQSGEAADAAQKLGEGLSKLALTATDVAETVILNIDRIGKVAKAVIAGLIVRQVVLMGNAMVTAGQQFIAAMIQMRGVMAGTTATTIANTRATLANNAARSAGAASLLTMKTGADAALSSILRMNGALGTSTGLMGRFALTFRGLGGALAGTAARLGAVSTILVGLAGPIGVAVTALALILPMLTNVSDGTDNMADQVEAALRRAGVAFEEFHNTAESSTQIEFNRLLQDLDLLDQGLRNFGKENVGGILGYRLALKALNNDIQVSDRIGRKAQAAFINLGATVGATTEQLESLSSANKVVLRGLIEAAIQAAETGRGFTELRSQIQESMRTNPGIRELLKNLDEFVLKAAQMEAAISSNRLRLVELYGTSGERLLRDFASTAESAVKTGKGLQELRKEMQELAKENPKVANGLEEIFNMTERAFASGMGIQQFRAMYLTVFDGTVRKIEEVRSASERAAARAAEVSKAFEQESKKALDSLESIGRFNPFVANVDPGVIRELDSAIAAYREFGTLDKPFRSVAEVLHDIKFDTSGAQKFAEALREQADIIADGSLSYTQIREEVERLNQANQGFDASPLVAGLSQIEANANNTIAALETYRNELGEDETAARELITALIEKVRAHADAEAAAYAAALAERAVASAAREAGTASSEAASGVLALASAFDTLAAARGAIQTATADALKLAQERIDVAKLKGADKAVANYFASWGEGGRVLSKIDDEIAKVDQAITKLSSEGLGENDGPVADLRKQAEALHKMREEFIASGTALARQQFELSQNKGRKGGGGRKKAIQETKDHAAAIRDLVKALSEELTGLTANNTALQMQVNGITSSARAARLLADAFSNGATYIDATTMAMVRQIEKAEKLGEVLQRIAKDPVRDWLNSVPSWLEAGRQIETGVLDHLSGTISKFIQTGEFSFEELGNAILGTVADIVSDIAVKELVALLGGNISNTGEGGFGLGTLLSNAFGTNSLAQPGGSLPQQAAALAGSVPVAGADGSVTMQQAILQGSQQGAELFRTALTSGAQQAATAVAQGGTQAATTMQTSIQTGGTAAASQMQTQTMTGGTIAATQMNTQTISGGATAAVQMQQGIVAGGNVAAANMAQATAGGGGGGGFFGGGLGGILLGAGLGLLSGLLSSRSSKPSTPEGPVTPIGIRQFAEGTPNTSGIPAILHDNEAVIPLSRGRKVPVEMQDNGNDSRGGKTLIQNFNITTPDADSFRKSQKQIAAEAAASGQKALADNR